jgi:hypothetical protein
LMLLAANWQIKKAKMRGIDLFDNYFLSCIFNTPYESHRAA